MQMQPLLWIIFNDSSVPFGALIVTSVVIEYLLCFPCSGLVGVAAKRCGYQVCVIFGNPLGVNY